MSDAQLTDRKPSKKLGSLSLLWPFVRPYRGLAILAGIALISTAAISLILPLAVRQVVDNFQASSGSLLDRYFSIALVLVILLAIGTAARYFFVTILGERVVTDIRKALFARMISMSPSFFETLMTGEVLSRITTDTTLILSVIGSSVSVALRNLLILIGGLGLLLWTSPKLSGLVLLIVPVIIAPIVILGRRMRVLSRKNQDWIANSSGAASEALLSAQTIQAFTYEGQSRESFDEVTEKSYIAARQRISTRAIMTAIVIFLIFSGIVGVLWIGARDVRDGTMSVGMLVQFLIYAVLVAGAVGALTEIWGELQRAAGATERLGELLEARDDVEDPATPLPAPALREGAIEFDEVSFCYPSRPTQLSLDKFTMKIAPGETVAFVGPSGAGKTTIFQLILRFYDPSKGTIRFDGADLRDLARADFRRHIALVPQDPVIFAATAMDNIRFGNPTASDEAVREAARAAAAEDFLLRLPEGYDSQLGERGVMLSGGQKQRIAIARALLRDAPVMLLDEATSALDAESEASVQQAIDCLAEGRTTLIIAHRLATIKKADRIIVMDQGRIMGEGTHDDLVAEGGLYARLARLQFTAE